MPLFFFLLFFLFSGQDRKWSSAFAIWVTALVSLSSICIYFFFPTFHSPSSSSSSFYFLTFKSHLETEKEFAWVSPVTDNNAPSPNCSNKYHDHERNRKRKKKQVHGAHPAIS
jgi:hypothetical protein